MSKPPSTNVDPSLLISKVLENLGGKDKAWAIIDADYRETQLRWRQDVEVLGRILRSHLYLEQYLTDYLERATPNLAIRKAALRFSQKLDLISSLPQFAEIIAGIKHLNVIRNRLAHRLSAKVTQADAEIFLQASLFVALRSEGAKPHEASQEPLDVLEGFAQYASTCLSHEFSPFSVAHSAALKSIGENDKVQLPTKGT
ncbi:hypothetical protein [Polaromonas sp. AET17H-212]|uniref:hypothetical protein n=1 Tax=Polaromonas sp. AET17H-212 TaxID=1977061 RepID=UPI000BBC6DA7|nr:hypothetical protein [Polaromonas sp. AET17H-212]